MKAKALIFALRMVCLDVFAQVDFEKGYYIDDDGNGIDCFILRTKS